MPEAAICQLLPAPSRLLFAIRVIDHAMSQMQRGEAKSVNALLGMWNRCNFVSGATRV